MSLCSAGAAAVCIGGERGHIAVWRRGRVALLLSLLRLRLRLRLLLHHHLLLMLLRARPCRRS